MHDTKTPRPGPGKRTDLARVFCSITALALVAACAKEGDRPDPAPYLHPDADPADATPDVGDALSDAPAGQGADGPAADGPRGEAGELVPPGDPIELTCLPGPRRFEGAPLMEQQTTTEGVASEHAWYPCEPVYRIALDGGERLFHLRSELERDFTLYLALANRCGGMELPCPSWARAGRLVDLDLLVLTAPPGAAGGACAARSARRTLDDEKLTFRAHAGQDYWVVVDGPAGKGGTFALSGSCGTCLTPSAELGCNQTLMANTATRALASASRYSCQRKISSGDPAETIDGQAGFEDTYTVPVPPFGSGHTNYTVRLSGLSQDLNLFVVDDSGSSCGDLACFDRSAGPGTGGEEVHFSTSSTTPTFYTSPRVVVDGPQAGGAPYQLEVTCSPSCAPTEELSCGIPLTQNNESFDPAQLESYGTCLTGLTGPEVLYDLGQLAAGPHTVQLTGLSADLDIVVLRTRVNSFACDPATPCVASSSNPGTADERLTFEADGTSTYVLAVDGRGPAATSWYTVTLSSQTCRPLACSADGPPLILNCAEPLDLRRNDEANHAAPPVDGYACAPEATGNQLIYWLGLEPNSSYTLVLDQLTADLDLVLLGCGSSTPTPPNRCSSNPGTQSETLTFDSGDDHPFARVAVVGKSGAVGDYRLRVQAPSCQPSCGAAVFDPQSCPERHVTSSGDPTHYVPHRRFDGWPCTAATPGPEKVTLVRPTRTTSFTARLDGPHPELELLVVEARDLAALCGEPLTSCLAHRAAAGTSPAEVTFEGQPGRSYYVVVDTLSDQASTWELTIDATCP
jgi:hypothetical protein